MIRTIAYWLRQLILCGVIGLLFYILLDITLWYLPPQRGLMFWQWDHCGPIAVGDNFSVIFLTRNAHPFLAEYDQMIEIYGGTERDGERTGNLKLPMNTGGRTNISLRSGIIAGHRCLQFISA